MARKKSVSKVRTISSDQDKKSVRGVKRLPKKITAGRGDFRVLEDAPNPSPLAALVSVGTERAYAKAIKISDSIVQVKNNKVIRRSKNGAVEVITDLRPLREVEVGKKITLS